MFKIKVNRNIISVQETEPLTSGSVSVYQCQFDFDDSWEGFFRSAVFRVGPMVKTVPLDMEDTCDIPWELLVNKHIGLPVEVSVYGSKDEVETLPTIWDKLGRIRSGSEPGEDAKEPTPNVYGRLTSLVKIYADKVAGEVDAVHETVTEVEAAAKAAAEAVSQIGTAVSDTAASARAAEESRAASESAASTAVASADTATAASETATTASEQAAQSESKAATYASSAQQSAERAASGEEAAGSAIASADKAEEAATVAAAQALVASDAASVSVDAASSASQSESNARLSADAAMAFATEAEAWSRKAEQAAGGGVTSFNGRGGAVTSQVGDYTAEMVGADASGAAAKALKDANTYTDGKIEAIPNVPSWAMQASKPTYTASEVGADAQGSASSVLTQAKSYTDAKVPTKTSQLANDSGFLTGYTETDPTVPAWAKEASKPTYTASEVGADAVGAAAQALSDAKAYADSVAGSAGSGVTVYTATIGTNWTEDSNTGVKSQNVAIDGVTASNTAMVDHVFTDGTEYGDFVEAENQYLTYITNGYAETYDGGITFHIFGDAPTVEIPIVVEVV